MKATAISKLVYSFVAVAMILLPTKQVFAYWQPYMKPINSSLAQPTELTCSTLVSLGLACTSGPAAPAYQPQSRASNSGFGFNIFSSKAKATDSSDPVLTAAIASAGVKNIAGRQITLVKAPGTSGIYQLLNGRKHAFPTLGIFYDYGYKLDMVETISQQQIDKYPRAYLLRVNKKKTIYYLTETGMVRPMPDEKKVFNSYGDRKEDVVDISEKEFNFYPVNQFVYLEHPLNRDVFQVTSEGKRYLTPMAIARMRITEDQVAPINQIEFDWYMTLAPVIY
ncbi:MAG: hypothetical protein A3C88_00110 [Candidatus Yanofskybacteria bacterium RIFCSPHIGHO2_02_FULL_50_12]|uniref:Uncharacterized protein n=1 Tax=Candidatus Yanofskybacteria bacterium RIFCSPHIGHO2_02_FULL_50_12 TaxID=1802685 RepID=A0A1F8FUA8_9BACT|nr:MAG: hypothetical protein A3C88_00110 [Candidatus Yanofskybacteria bacterium RIFCSPHIGHO2_02_FULL_50_12]